MSATGVPWELILAVVVLLATVQSIFGVGMLLFGTPTLLLMDMPFTSVLAYLLPCSLMISTLQVATTGGLTLEPIRRSFLLFTAPAVVIGTAVALSLGSPSRIGIVVGVMLLLTAAMRIVPSGMEQLGRSVDRHLPWLLIGLGLVHGLSNLGGGVLTSIVSSIFDDKASIRRHIAFCYGVMATLQLSLVLVDGPTVNVRLALTLPLVAGVVYLIVGQRLFSAVTRAVFQHALTGLIATFGVLLVTR